MAHSPVKTQERPSKGLYTPEITSVVTRAGLVGHPTYQEMFNLTVSEAHTFYVGQDEWLVHNQTRTPGGAFTAPTLPPGTVVKQGSITIEHYYKGTDHGPAHLHVTGGGKTVRIGMNGKPLEGEPALTSAQKRIVEENLKEIRKTGQKIGKYMEFLDKMAEFCE